MKTEINDIDEIHNAIIAFANGEFEKRLIARKGEDNRNSLIESINMLGEELEHTVISRNYFSRIYNAVSDIMIVTNNRGIITDVNEAALLALKASKEELLNDDIRNYCNKNQKKLIASILDIFTTGKKSITIESELNDSEVKNIPVLCTITTIRSESQNIEGYLLLAKDITEKKEREKMEARIRIQAQEDERKRLAYDLHDSIGQELNSLSMHLSALNSISKKDAKYKTTVNACSQILLGSINQIREISFTLSPNSLKYGTMKSAILELLKTAEIKLKITSQLTGLEKVKCDEAKLTLYRITQEFITNTLKYSNAKELIVKSKIHKNELHYNLYDNGIGFDFQKVKQGNGILNMKSRLTALNAEFELTSSPGSGTYLGIKINLPK